MTTRNSRSSARAAAAADKDEPMGDSTLRGRSESPVKGADQIMSQVSVSSLKE
jgi:hypothetical protein